ncbi:hypothetical protein MSS2_04707 [Mycobacterium marinum]|nr:hypothetical protein MSS2_04707 [Mycobacterium marinum]
MILMPVVKILSSCERLLDNGLMRPLGHEDCDEAGTFPRFRYDAIGLRGKRMWLLDGLQTSDAGRLQHAFVGIDDVICLDDTPSVMHVRRDALWAIAQRRGLDLDTFGIFSDVTAVIRDSPNAVHTELDLAAGVEHEFRRWTEEPTGVETWRRLKLCEQILLRPAQRADCIVWLRLAPTSLPQCEVTHGQVTFYNADFLSSFVGHPEHADRFKVPPVEILDPQQEPPILLKGEVEWERNWHMAYARVMLRDTVIHTASTKAKTMVEALKAVHHANRDTWKILSGSILFIDGRRASPMSWGAQEDIPEPFRPEADWMGQDIERMPARNQTLDEKSLDDLQGAISLSAGLKDASELSPQATVMAAVRAIEYVNARTTGGGQHWADFVSAHFKKAQSRVKLVELIGAHTRAAVHILSPGLAPSDPRNREYTDIRSKTSVSEWPHQMFNAREAADHIPALKRIYADHYLVRGLGQLEGILATPASMYAQLEEQGRRFDRQLGRLKRLRNSAIHGGPLSDAACVSVAAFARSLGHQCLNEAMRALLIGTDIPSHISDYRIDNIERYEEVKTAGDIDALFVVWS